MPKLKQIGETSLIQVEDERLTRLRELFVPSNRHTFLKPGNGNLGRLMKDFYLIPAELVDEIVDG